MIKPFQETRKLPLAAFQKSLAVITPDFSVIHTCRNDMPPIVAAFHKVDAPAPAAAQPFRGFSASSFTSVVTAARLAGQVQYTCHNNPFSFIHKLYIHT